MASTKKTPITITLALPGVGLLALRQPLEEEGFVLFTNVRDLHVLYITERIEEHDHILIYASPCTPLLELGEANSTYDLRRMSARRADGLCPIQVAEEWNSKLEDIVDCQPDHETMLGLAGRVVKMFVMWIIAAVVMCLVVATSITTTTVVLNNEIDFVEENVRAAYTTNNGLLRGVYVSKSINTAYAKNFGLFFETARHDFRSFTLRT